MPAANIELDFDQLRMLSGDDEEFMIEILEMITEQSPTVLSQLGELFDAGDFAKLGSTAHQYKSSVNILGNVHINQLLKDLENTAVDVQEAAAIFPLLEDLKSACNQMLEQVHAELENIKG